MGKPEIDVDGLRSRIEETARSEWPGARVRAVRRLLGGASSLTFHAILETAPVPDMIVKVAPPGIAPVLHRDVLRQARLLSALAGSADVKVPGILLMDQGAPPEVPPFFAMERVEGESVEPYADGAEALPPVPVLANRAVHAAAVLGGLHDVPAADLDLGDEPVVTVEAEIERWAKAYATLGDDLRGPAERWGAALLDSAPAPVAPVVLHGDYRLGNMLCRDREVAAVIDWEIWSLGDPRFDLGWFLANSCGDQPTAVRTLSGLPSAESLRQTYEQARGTAVTDSAWFDAAARYKAGAAIGLIVKHNRSRRKPAPHLEAMAPHPAAFLAQTRDILEAGVLA